MTRIFEEYDHLKVPHGISTDGLDSETIKYLVNKENKFKTICVIIGFFLCVIAGVLFFFEMKLIEGNIQHFEKMDLTYSDLSIATQSKYATVSFFSLGVITIFLAILKPSKHKKS